MQQPFQTTGVYQKYKYPKTSSHNVMLKSEKRRSNTRTLTIQAHKFIRKTRATNKSFNTDHLNKLPGITACKDKAKNNN